MKGARILYSREELVWTQRHCTLPRREAHAMFCRTFGRTDVTFNNFNALCTRNGWTTGRTGYFPPGMTPHNKGKRMPSHPNSVKTQFQRGNLPHNTRYLGHERIERGGYVEISVDRRNPHTGFWRRYVLKHRYLWEQQHGPVPPGHALKCLDGNRLNTDPANWELISRSLLPLLNGHRGPSYAVAEPEVKPVVLAVAKLRAAVSRKRV